MRYVIGILCGIILSVAGLSGIAVADVLPAKPVSNMSLPLWQPTEEQKQEVEKAVQSYFAALDEGDFASAYGIMSDVVRRMLPKENYIDQILFP